MTEPPKSLFSRKNYHPASETFATQIRAGDQPQNRQGARSQPLVWTTQHRRRGDRIAAILLRRRMSAFGTKRTSRHARSMSAFGG